jgi:hypothetical protein
MDLSLKSIVSSVTGGVSGPLSSLYRNNYQRATYQYPRNLGTDSTRRHYISFTILEPDTSYNNEIGNNLKAIGDKAVGELKSEVKETATSALTTALTTAADSVLPGSGAFFGNLIGTAKTLGSGASAAIQTIAQADVKRRPRTYINLYVPDTVQVSYGAIYNDQSLVDALGTPYFLAQAGSSVINAAENLLKGGTPSVANILNAAGNDPYVRQVAGTLLGKAGLVADGQAVSQLLNRGIGQAVNPQMQVLFQSVDFRTFSFDFTFTPYSAEEALAIEKIIYEFKYASAPEINRNGVFGTQGMFFKVPDMFDIQFFYDGRENRKVHRITRCVLQNISVDYAPIGWATYDGGEPVQTKLSLQFKEIEIVDKTRIKDGY